MLKKRRKRNKAVRTHRKSLREWSLKVRARDKCLQAHHILPKKYFQEYMLDVNIGVTLCPRCHTFSGYSAEKNAIWFSEWLKENRKWQWEYCAELLKINHDKKDSLINNTNSK